MSLHKTIIETILKECDQDIQDLMMKQEDFRGGAVPTRYHGYELIDNPASTILAWQAMRERNRAPKLIMKKPSGVTDKEINTSPFCRTGNHKECKSVNCICSCHV